MPGLKFIGGAGQFLPGVPARDLTAGEVERYPRASESALYEPRGARRPADEEVDDG